MTAFRALAFISVSYTHLDVYKRQEIVYAGIEAAKSRMHASKIRIAAQTYVRSLYENIGFKQSSEEFMEDGIPHIEMILSIDQKNLV